MARHMNRSAVTGRFARMGDSIEDIENVSASDVRPGMEVPRHAPAGDDLAGRPYPGALRPRMARMTPGGSERLVYATPRPETFSGQHTGDAGRPVPQQIQYLTGDIDETAPGDVPATQKYGVQGRRGREAARRSSDPTTRFVTGADDDE